MDEYKYNYTEECPSDLVQNEVIEKWKRFLKDCHVDFKLKYIVANDNLKDCFTAQINKQSIKDCPEIDILMPQIETALRIKRISDDELREIEVEFNQE